MQRDAAESWRPLLRRASWPGWLGLAAALTLSAVLNFSRLGAPTLLGDESIYATPAREAAMHGRWYPLSYGFRSLYVSKPPLVAWPVALSFRLNGVSEWADRLPSALAGVAEVGLLFLFAAWLIDPWTGLLAAALLATSRSWLFMHGAREGVGEPLLCLLVTGTLLLYLRYRTSGRRRWLAAAVALTMLASLIKGPVAPLLVGLTTLAWEVLRPRLPAAAADELGPSAPTGLPASRWRGPAALLLLGLALYAVWMVDTTLRLRAMFVWRLYQDMVLRITTGLDPGHLHGPDYYFDVLKEAFGHWWWALMPAVFYLAEVFRAGGARARAWLLVVIWPVVLLAMLEVSVSKLPWYLDTGLPALAILLAAGAGYLVRRLARWPAAWPVAWLAAAVLAGLVGLRATWAWHIIHKPPHIGLMSRFDTAFRQIPGAHIYVENWGAGVMREWNYFYLMELEDAVQPLSNLQQLDGCTFIFTLHPETVAARLHVTAEAVVPVEHYDPGESPFQLLDLCGGRVAALLR